jgi:hypothetical protein
MRGVGAERHQAADRRPGLSTGARLEPAAQKDQGDDDGRRLEIDETPGFGDGRGGEGDERGPGPGGGGAQHHEAVHFGRALEERGQAEAEEDAARTGQNGGREQELDQVQRKGAECRHLPMVEGGDQVAAHFHHEDGERQGGGDPEGAAHRRGLVQSFGFGIGAVGSGRVEIGDGITGLVHRGLNHGPGVGIGQTDIGALEGEVHLRLQHLGQGVQRLFRARGATAAIQVADAGAQGDAIDGMHRIARRDHVGCKGGRVKARPDAQVGPPRGKVDHGAFDARNGGKGGFGTRNAAAAGQVVDAVAAEGGGGRVFGHGVSFHGDR